MPAYKMTAKQRAIMSTWSPSGSGSFWPFGGLASSRVAGSTGVLGGMTGMVLGFWGLGGDRDGSGLTGDLTGWCCGLLPCEGVSDCDGVCRSVSKKQYYIDVSISNTNMYKFHADNLKQNAVKRYAYRQMQKISNFFHDKSQPLDRTKKVEVG